MTAFDRFLDERAEAVRLEFRCRALLKVGSRVAHAARAARTGGPWAWDELDRALAAWEWVSGERDAPRHKGEQ